MDRATVIEAALVRRNLAGHLRRRIERLLDGVEDRTRLRCCNSGCFVCTDELLAVVIEIESELHKPN